MKVVLSVTARTGLLNIGEHIAQNNPVRARSFLAELRAKVRQLGDMPLAFPLLPHSKHASVRRRAYKGYLIFYRVEEDRVVVLHVVHGAQGFEALVFPSE